MTITGCALPDPEPPATSAGVAGAVEGAVDGEADVVAPAGVESEGAERDGVAVLLTALRVRAGELLVGVAVVRGAALVTDRAAEVAACDADESADLGGDDTPQAPSARARALPAARAQARFTRSR